VLDFAEQYSDYLVPVELDVCNYEQIKEVAKKIKDIQILINNAGFAGDSGCFYNYNEDVAKYEMEVNYYGPMRLINEFSSQLLESTQAAIVNVVSIGAFTPAPMHITYSAAKAAMYSVTGALRLELRGRIFLYLECIQDRLILPWQKNLMRTRNRLKLLQCACLMEWQTVC